LFEAWNGRKAVYLIDEEEQFVELATAEPGWHGSGAPPHLAASHKKRKSRRQMAKRSRRRNRGR
jgi:hypothetical protein